MASKWIWPGVMGISAVGAVFCTAVATEFPLRPLIVLWFLAVCPGMAFVPLFHLRDRLAEWVVALALSFTLDGAVVGFFLYAHFWSPIHILISIIGLTLLGIGMQFVHQEPAHG